jgi:hypothetical protein
LGIYDAGDELIHIDDTVVESKQTFIKLHETGHHELPTHRKVFRIFQDCEKTLAPDIADLFERETNNFARYALFQGDGFGRMAADYALELKTPMKLGKKFGASIYAACREMRGRTTGRAWSMCWSRSSIARVAAPAPQCGASSPHRHSPCGSAETTITWIIRSARFCRSAAR